MTALAWLMRRSAKTVNAATGYLVWWAVLALVIVSPFLIGDPAAESLQPAIEQNQAVAPISNLQLTMLPPDHKADRIVLMVPASEAESEDDVQLASFARVDIQQSRIEETKSVTGSVTPESKPSVMSVLARMFPVSLFALWVCVSTVLVVRIWLAYRRMVAIKRRSHPFDALRFPRVDGLLRRAAIRRKTALHLTDEIGSPVAAGLGNPIILIPRTMAGQLTERELEAVVVHELAHILRWDDWTKLAQKIIEALLFFNPAVRWIGRHLELEREIACDDRVVAQTGQPTEYARC